MKSTDPRQGRISGWLKMNCSALKELAEHLRLSVPRTSRVCNLSEVPTDVRAAMKTFVTPTGKHIPIVYLPRGVDKQRGPKPGWLQDKLSKARQEGSGASDAA
ncbi:MAG: hypothetical protein JEY79_11020 [Pseudodesulfovibrio sp.]|nr:hypothetical protein [Pseudodesulfovibrio sp.]